MADQHVRAWCTLTGAVASLPKRALELGHIKHWVAEGASAPKRTKSPAVPRKKAVKAAEVADSESANKEEE